MDTLYTTLKTFGQVKLNEPLNKHTTFKIGGPARYFVIVKETDQLVALLQFLDSEGQEYFILGGGSNMLAQDEAYDGVVVNIQNTEFKIENTTLVADAGCATVAMAQESIKANLSGFEWGVGVPGTIGGAVRGNAGAMGGEMKDVVVSVDAYMNGQVVMLTNEECEFQYRHSVFKENGGVVLRVRLALSVSENKEGMKEALQYLQYRNKTQPQGWASTGCIFKNVVLENSKHQDTNTKIVIPQEFLKKGSVSAGWLVEQSGMKGARVGKALVSERHGNFIVNEGGATAHDVRTLVEQVKAAVYNKTGLVIEEEMQVMS